MKNRILYLAFIVFACIACQQSNSIYEKQIELSKDSSKKSLSVGLYLTETPHPEHFFRIKALVDLGADLEFTSSSSSGGFTPFLNAAGAYKMLKKSCYRKNRAARDSMETAAIMMVKYLAKEGANVHTTNTAKHNALHLAGLCGRARMIPVLVNLGVDINAREENLRTPLMLAAYSGDFKTVKAIVELGGDINAMENQGYTPLDVATMSQQDYFTTYKEHGAIKEYLIKLGAKKGKGRRMPI